MIGNKNLNIIDNEAEAIPNIPNTNLKRFSCVSVPKRRKIVERLIGIICHRFPIDLFTNFETMYNKEEIETQWPVALNLMVFPWDHSNDNRSEFSKMEWRDFPTLERLISSTWPSLPLKEWKIDGFDKNKERLKSLVPILKYLLPERHNKRRWKIATLFLSNNLLLYCLNEGYLW